MSSINIEKDFVMFVGVQTVKKDIFGKLYLSNDDRNPASFETDEDAYIAKNNSDNEDIRQYARIYNREVTTRLERA